MTNEEKLEALKSVANIAALAELKGEVDDDGPTFAMVFGELDP